MVSEAATSKYAVYPTNIKLHSAQSKKKSYILLYTINSIQNFVKASGPVVVHVESP